MAGGGIKEIWELGTRWCRFNEFAPVTRCFTPFFYLSNILDSKWIILKRGRMRKENFRKWKNMKTSESKKIKQLDKTYPILNCPQNCDIKIKINMGIANGRDFAECANCAYVY